MEVSLTYWDEQAELMNRENIEKIQLSSLPKPLNRAWYHLSYYWDKLSQQGIDIHHFRSLNDLSRLPFTTKDDLRKAYPFGAMAEPLRQIIRLHSSAGTTGTATVVR